MASTSSSGKLSLTVVLNNGEKVLPLELAPDTQILVVKRLVAGEFSLPVSEQKMLFQGKPLEDTKTLAQSGVKSSDILAVQGATISNNWTSLNQIPPQIWQNPAALQETIRGNPKLLNQLLNQNPTLAEAVMSNNTFMLQQYFLEQKRARDEVKQKEDMEIARLQANPLDPAAQAKIQEIIRQRNVKENMEQALEHNPEAFGSVIMLYVPCSVNKIPLKAFVDSGAQMTIMSMKCAEKVGLAHLIDRRWQGMAKGVGTSRILGRIHAAPIKLGNANFMMSITILENQDMEFLFGLDQLRRHQASIDLKENCLRIQGQNVPFLSEKDIPKSELFHPSSKPSSKEEKKSNHQNKKQKMDTSNVPKTNNTATSSSSSNTIRQNQRATGITPEKVAQLVQMSGMNEAKVLEALQVCNGNVELAASYLFNSMGQ
mmetsp:Transcript_18960/g.46553  ORF Transcript_18960/g.46553 Transcript_18960/m.46553 type:complete len:429 (-) Transcript_18960:209-1495(-)